MNTQRPIRFAVGVWVMFFAIAFLSSIVVEIIRASPGRANVSLLILSRSRNYSQY